MVETERRTRPQLASPYRGLVPFSEDDAGLFFGRDRERQIIVANLLAYRLTLLYGESGVGKTSVLRAGAVNQLRRQSRATLEELGTPETIVVEFASWRDDPVASLVEAVDRSVRLVLGDATPELPDPSPGLAERLDSWATLLDTQFLVILDQFEEYLLYHGDEDGEGTFAVEFPRAVNRPDLRANFLVAIREDALAGLDRFKGRIPDLFGNYLRIRHLDRDSARRAIVGPLDEYNRLAGDDGGAVAIEPELVEAVLDQVKTGRVVVGETGQGTITQAAQPQDHIETPYLQLVMSRLWDEERAADSSLLQIATLDRLGGAERIVRSHLDETMGALPPDDREAAARVFRFLVTPGGTKIAHTAGDLAQYAEIPVGRLEEVLEGLAGGEVRILRAGTPAPGELVPRYEIFHDVLAPAILDWRSRYEESRRRAEALTEERQKAQARLRATRRRATLAFVLAGVGVVAALAISALQQRNLARSQALAAQAMVEAGVDSQLSLHLALDALAASRSPQAEDALRLALSQARLQSVVGGHSDVVWSAAFSPDGGRVVTASSDTTARVADAATGATIAELLGHADIVSGAAFTPDGGRVVTTSYDGTARLWDAATGEQLAVLEHGDLTFLARSEAFDAGGRYVATGPFTGDGRFLVTTAGSAAWIWDLSTGALERRLEHPPEALLVTSAAFSPGGDLVVTAAFDGLVRVWDVATGAPHADPMDNLTEYVSSAAFSPNGRFVAAANSDGSVGLWNVATGEMTWSQGHTHEVLTVAFSPDGTRLVSAGDQTAAIWEIDGVAFTLSLVTVVRPHASWVKEARFSPDGSYVVTANQDGTARLADARTGEELFGLRGHANVVWTAAFAPDGHRVVTASEDGTARVWSVDTGLELRGHDLAVTAAAFSPDGRRVVTAGVDETARIWDASSGKVLQVLQGDVADFGWLAMNSATFSGDGALVVTAQASGTVALWDAGTGEQVGVCCDGFFALDAAFLGGRNDRIAVLYRDETIRVWDLGDDPSGVELHRIDEVHGLAIGPDAASIVTFGRWDKMARVWDADTFEILAEWEGGLVTGVAVSPDGRQVATAGLDRVIRLWDLETGELRLELVGSTSTVGSVAFSPDGSWLVSGSDEGTTRVWDTESGRPLALLRMHADSVNFVDVTPDGRIVSAGNDSTAKIYTCETCGSIEDVVARARQQVAITPRTG